MLQPDVEFLPLRSGSFQGFRLSWNERNQDSQRKSFQISNLASCFWLSAGSVTLGRCLSAQLLVSVKNHCLCSQVLEPQERLSGSRLGP